MDEARARKERLIALRTAKELTTTAEHKENAEANGETKEQLEDEPTTAVDKDEDTDNEDANGAQEAEEDEEEDRLLPKLKFRNYIPKDEDLKNAKLAKPKLPTVEEQLESATSGVQETLAEAAEAPLNVATKKPNWDLKRDVAKRLEKLQRRTVRCIHELLRQRMEQEAQEEDGEDQDDAEAEANPS
mmetsp:Transcript_13698/g.23500  ORF Transcript_13698/g.23500 Transcript_13698/m.23500 type:complete len:187 (+) Transcript_13698:56-616(+)|eukprot:CAMPEP_0196663106 /NCGR_PEP_ID=MMETSP1086-20130531/51510_1 /TAXON_ID=77921 /ORGANISM="Cyanoptyche  gloeocystis , Strain SAG4.97" /LENGTH=186 /DNA_ID=CAMNT_0041998801 /DNA_START=49 /DNA_END=609 /DNA_ORIENTATION=-